MALRRQKSKKSQVVDLLETYLKLQAAKKATKGARKAAKGTAVYQVAKRTPFVRRNATGRSTTLIASPSASATARSPSSGANQGSAITIINRLCVQVQAL